MRKIVSSLVALTVITIGAEDLNKAFTNATTEGQLRFGAVEIEDDSKSKHSTLSLGGSIGVKTDPFKGVSLGAKLYTTNALFGRDDEGMFLDSQNSNYSIVGEAYIQADLGKTSIKAGRQIVDTPYANSDDIGMIPNTFEGYTLVNQDIADTTVILASLDKWSGVDADTPESFTDLQSSSDAVLMASLIYEGIESTTLQAWHYRLDDANFNYLEASYETELFNLAGQYVDQDNDNRAFGLSAGANISDFALSVAYNRVDGVVSNGFGGGPFFTSTEDHTIDGEVDQEAILVGGEYAIGKATVALSHGEFDKGENETDYVISYAVNDNHTLDLIYSDMYDDGKMVRFFANYNF